MQDFCCFFYSNFIFIKSKQQNCMELFMNFPRASSPKLSNSCLFVVLFDSRFSSTPSPNKFRFFRWMMKLPTSPTLRNADQPVHIYLVMRGWIPWKVDLGGVSVGCESLNRSWLVGGFVILLRYEYSNYSW